MDIKEKTVLITGSASGLGAATARELSKRGAKIILLDKNISQAEKIAAEIHAKAFECDVTSENSVKNIISQCGEIHAAINCAGIIHGARIVGKNGAMPLDDFSRVIQINLIGTFNVLRLVAEKMSTQKILNEVGERGVIINTASIAAFEGQLGQIAYSASKGGVAAMTLPAARELSKFGIRVMTIAPGVMQTPMVSGMTEEVQKQLSADVPFPKQLGDSKNYGELCAHIIENNYLNGSVIRLDGALRLR
ncbi:MAG TPA: SDR family NAD(P)-dependent oxidoreductase [Coxiellaceae bacterium]|nr:MAG: 3-hydroxy-2-methylbutyryl-CoA dehydrogenase [Gammaproteobacteria bacterium RIFCSPHIGHO2_12_FULL_36_30]HLB56741.1 SDR family NAD(P)-dependent oxidoreductase [Coxiellaceae bacterium]